MKNITKWFLTRMMLWAGKVRFPYIIVYTESGRDSSAIHFADDDRSMNTSMRAHIDALDESYLPPPWTKLSEKETE